MEEEHWKFYKETTSPRWGTRKYEISNLGNVKINGILKKCGITNSGYYSISGIGLIHRAVAELFVPNPGNKPCVDHINCNKLDNRAQNLRWVTYSENMNNPITIEYIKLHTRDMKGENNPMYGKHHSKSSRKLISDNKRGVSVNKGEKNPMYGKNSEDFMTLEAIKEKNRKIREAAKLRWTRRKAHSI